MADSTTVNLTFCQIVLSWMQQNRILRFWWLININSGNIWLGAVRQQAINWASVDPNLCAHMSSPGHNELMTS